MIKIGILTYHRSKNYGAFLQAYALCNRLNMEKEIDAEIIDFNMLKAENYYNANYSLIDTIKKYKYVQFYKKLNEAFNKSYNNLKLSSFKLIDDEINPISKEINNKYDIVITGSDEIWKLDSFRGFPTPYWLPIKIKGKKVSYAASCRTLLSDVDDKTVNKIKTLLDDYEIITVRDKKTYNEFKNNAHINKRIYIMPDPTLTYKFNINIENGKKILNRIKKIDKNKKIALVMIGDDRIVKILRDMYSEKYNLISIFKYHDNLINLSNLTPFDWIDVIAASDFIFTTYFHATCFSIINNKNFMVIGDINKSDKTSELLKNSNNFDRFIEFKEDTTDIDINNVYEKCLINKDNTEFLNICESEMKKFIEMIKK